MAIDPARSPEHEILPADGEVIRAVSLPEGLRQPVEIEVAEHWVPVVHLALLIAMKLVSASSNNRPHDLEDACAAMAVYEQSGSRRYEIDYERFGEASYETAGALLAGLDSAEMIEAPTRHAIDVAIAQHLAATQLTDRYADGPARRKLVLAFRTGLSSSLKPRRD
ncbi:MAG: hypothetical protein MUO39_03340 [Steroidobacteraceae bacterium]|nr:hypothetical protein [Steroidobacteraceae bacterium]